MSTLEQKCYKHMESLCIENPDPSHDILHVDRVVAMAKKLAEKEGADLEVVTISAYLHDCVYISKADIRRKQASKLSAEKAIELLSDWGVTDKVKLDKIYHAVLTHSFSANIEAKSLEAQIVQDADRLDALGAIGIARTLAFSGVAKRALYNAEDAFCNTREPNDATNALDHFFIKLLKLQEKLNTQSARDEGLKRLEVMNLYLDAFKKELDF